MISLTVLTVAVYLMSSTITATMAHSSKRKERTLALEAAMNQLEAMRALPFRELAQRFNADPTDDPDGPGTAQGNLFVVPGLSPQEGQPAVGTIEMPLVANRVREDVVIPKLGMPRDLNGDFVVDADDHSDNYMLLPIRVRVAWAGTGGNRELVMTSMYSAVQRHLE
ncbi:MAG: hypothetical protein R3F17_01915 [Planctomycetota bacterium]